MGRDVADDAEIQSDSLRQVNSPEPFDTAPNFALKKKPVLLVGRMDTKQQQITREKLIVYFFYTQ